MADKILISFRIDKAILTDLKKKSEKDGRTYSEVLRQLIADYLKKED
jgi:hypothetical protein